MSTRQKNSFQIKTRIIEEDSDVPFSGHGSVQRAAVAQDMCAALYYPLPPKTAIKNIL
jgi:hypothetical protein